MTLLADEQFDDFVKEQIVEMAMSTMRWTTAWETFKLKLRAFAIERSNVLAFQEKFRENELHKALL